jgi:hypothetical protein
MVTGLVVLGIGASTSHFSQVGAIETNVTTPQDVEIKLGSGTTAKTIALEHHSTRGDGVACLTIIVVDGTQATPVCGAAVASQ